MLICDALIRALTSSLYLFISRLLFFFPISMILLRLIVFIGMCWAHQYYNESLDLTPLPKNSFLGSFQFEMESYPFTLDYKSSESTKGTLAHYSYFPKLLGPVIENTNTRELHLRFTQGWWDAESWGILPHDGLKSGGTGVEMSAVIEAPDLQTARKQWKKLTNTLSGFFCASLNFIDDSNTVSPRIHNENPVNDTVSSKTFVLDPNNKLFYLRAALPSEPICTENLTPFLKMLPTRGKAGVASLLDGHKLFDSLWHGMSIDVTTLCDDGTCHLRLEQSINHVVDVMRSKRKHSEGGIPKPTPGFLLRCDDTRKFDIWQCYPSDDPVDLSWSLQTLYGRAILGPAFSDDLESSRISINIDPLWDVSFAIDEDDSVVYWSVSDGNKTKIVEKIKHITEPTDIRFETRNSSIVLPIYEPPLKVSRSLTGYSQDKGGFRTSLTNPSETEPVLVNYFESLPWFMRLYLHTLKVSLRNSTGTYIGADAYIKDRFFQPAIDRKRPSHLEFIIEIPPLLTLVMTTQFDKSLLLYHEYPPDANHGFAVDPAVVTVLNRSSPYEIRTTSLLLTLPTPDFSMPYNVIILTCTVFSLAFGSFYNLLTKKVITEEELEKLVQESKITKLRNKVRAGVKRVRALVGR